MADTPSLPPDADTPFVGRAEDAHVRLLDAAIAAVGEELAAALDERRVFGPPVAIITIHRITEIARRPRRISLAVTLEDH